MKIKSFLLENIGIKQTIFKNTFWLTLAEFLSRSLEAVLVIYIVRVLGVVQFGKFAFAMAVASLFVSFSGLGLAEIITREIAYDKKTEKEYSAVLSFKIILNVMVFFLALVASLVVTQDPLIRLIIMVLTVFYFCNDFFSIIYAFLRAHQKMQYEAGFKILRSLVLILVVSLVVYKNPSIQNISYGYLLANFLALVLVLAFFHSKVHSLKLSFDITIWKKFFHLSWPLGLAAIFGAMYINMDSVIMGHFGQIMQNGWYGAARRTVGIIIIPATLVFMSFYPMASKLFKESKELLQRLWDRYIALMIFFAFPITAGGVVLAQKLMMLIYGPGFSASTPLFQILIFIVGINFLYYPYALILIVLGQQKKYLWNHLLGALANLGLNLMLIPAYGAYGACISAVTTFLVLLVTAIVFSKYSTPISIFSRQLFIFLAMIIVSTFVMSASLVQPIIYQANIFYSVIFGASVYVAILLLLYHILKKYGFSPEFLKVTIGKATLL